MCKIIILGNPRYMSFSLASIDPSSIQSKEAGFDPDAVSEFLEKHPHCEANPECNQTYMNFFDLAPRLWRVMFHTADLKPLVERGFCSPSGGCRPSDTTSRVLIFFKNKDRAAIPPTLAQKRPVSGRAIFYPGNRGRRGTAVLDRIVDGWRGSCAEHPGAIACWLESENSKVGEPSRFG
jgi:hypothetical protein